MAKTLSIADTVESLLRDAAPEGSLKSASVKKEAPQTKLPPMRKLAETLRNLPEPELTYPILHVVKIAMANRGLGPLPEPQLQPVVGSTKVASLRKLANALRAEDAADHSRLLAKGAHALRATRGIMLLRELVRE